MPSLVEAIHSPELSVPSDIVDAVLMAAKKD